MDACNGVRWRNYYCSGYSGGTCTYSEACETTCGAQCEAGQTSCGGLYNHDYLTCNTGTCTWTNNGRVIGQCGVSCTSAADCGYHQYCAYVSSSCGTLPLCMQANAGYDYTYQPDNSDIYSECSISSWACWTNCRRYHSDGFCDGAGACDTNDVQENCAAGYHCTGSPASCVSGLCSTSRECTVTPGDNQFNDLITGDYVCQGTCDGGGSCDYATSCTYCPSSNGCYPVGSGCEERNYFCTCCSMGDAYCDYTPSNQHSDSVGSWEYYCSGDTVRRRRLYYNYGCSGSSCAYLGSYYTDDQLYQSCTGDGWYDTSSWTCVGDCTRQKNQEYRDYTCKGSSPTAYCGYNWGGSQTLTEYASTNQHCTDYPAYFTSLNWCATGSPVCNGDCQTREPTLECDGSTHLCTVPDGGYTNYVNAPAGQHCSGSSFTSVGYCDIGTYQCVGSCGRSQPTYECQAGGGPCTLFDYWANTLYCSAGEACSGTTCSSSNYCDATTRCSSGSGNNNYNTGGDWTCQGRCDGSNNCDYAVNCAFCTTGDAIDDDDGLDFYNNGTCSAGTGGCSSGSCVFGTGGGTDSCGGVVLTEYYNLSIDCLTTTTSCINGCDAGACITSNIDNCTVIKSFGEYNLNVSIAGAPNDASEFRASAKACIKISGDNVIFDCATFNIKNNGTLGYTIGIAINGSAQNVTIRNCPSLSDYWSGVYIHHATNNTIDNVYAHNNSVNFRVDNGIYNNISGSTSYNSTAGYGFYITDSNYTTIEDSTARYASGSYDGIYLGNSTGSTLLRNTIYENGGDGIGIGGWSNGTYAEGNEIYDNGDWGFSTSYSGNITLYNNTVYWNTDGGIELYTMLVNSTIYRNRVFNNSNNGIYIISNYGNNLSDNILFNNSFYGIEISNSNYTYIRNNTIASNRRGIYMPGGRFTSLGYNVLANNSQYGLYMAGNNTFMDRDRIYGNQWYDIYFPVGGNRNFTATRLIIDNPKGTMENYTTFGTYNDVLEESYAIKWSANSATLPLSRTRFNNKSVNITDFGGSASIDRAIWWWDDSELSGYVESNLALWEYTSGGTWILRNNTPRVSDNILSLENFDPSSDYVILEEPPNCPVISTPGLYRMPFDYVGAPNSAAPLGGTACVKITTSDVVFDCNGYTISYDGSFTTRGILVTGPSTNVTIQNCSNIAQYTHGIYVYRSNYSHVHNVTVFNNTWDGMYFDSSSHGSVSDSWARENSRDGIKVFYGINLSIYDNVATNNSDGFILRYSNHSRVDNNYAENNTIGFAFWNEVAYLNITRNRAIRNYNAGFASYGFWIYITSGTHSVQNRFINNTAEFNKDGGFKFDYLNIPANAFNNLTGNNATGNGGRGFSVISASYCNLTDNIAFNNSYRGFDVESSYNRMTFNLAYNNTGDGIFLTDPGNYLANNTVHHNDRGIYVYSDSGNVLVGNSFYNNTIGGIFMRQTNANNLSLNSVYNNTVYGINLSESDYNNFTNNTLQENMFGTWLDSNSDGNLFYFNIFINSTYLHAYAAAPGNHFNYSNVTPCDDVSPEFCARGNYWDDIIELDIRDTNSDDFGDSGTEYPYNRANNANVSTNVQDDGPISGITDPEGSIMIYGPNGTIITGTRNVFLNLSFADDKCLAGCRWANDNPANLNNYPFENCTTVKPWILSPGYGNKTVYYQIRNCYGNNITLNDSILYRFMQDYTGPTPPAVYDSDTGVDIDWSNDNTSLSAYWWNATDDISTLYYRYRILNNSVCFENDCTWTDAGTDNDVTVSGFLLEECSNYSFQVMAYTSSGMNSTIGTSNGTIIDTTRPDAPGINSTTHPYPGTTYTSGTVRFNFSAEDAGPCPSGVAGYSYVLDQYPGTAPDSNMESRQWLTLSSMVNDGYSQLLRENSSFGSPHTYAVFSQIDSNFTYGDSVRVRVALAELGTDYDDLMGIRVYMVSDSNGFDINDFDDNGVVVSSVATAFRDIRYAETMGSAAVYWFDLAMNATLDDNVNDTYVVVSGIMSDIDNRNNLSIAGSMTDIDNTTRNFVCDNSGSCVENTSTLDYAIEVKRQDTGAWDVEYGNLRDGTYYFHVKARDRAGNWGDTSHFNITIDTEGVNVDILDPFTGTVFTNENVTVTVRVNELANVTVIAIHPDGTNDTSDWKMFSGTSILNVTIENGTNEVYARAVHPINGVITYSQSIFIRLGTGVEAGNRSLRVKYGSGMTCAQYLCYKTEGTTRVGFAVENSSASTGSDSLGSDTARFSIKIFATTDDMDTSDVTTDISTDSFLDRVQPMFGYEKGVPYYLIRTEVRPFNVHLEGDVRAGPGKRTIVFKNMGYTHDGKANITVRII